MTDAGTELDEVALNRQTERLVNTLRESGIRLTTPRRAVIEALLLLDTHPTADDLVSLISERYPEVHRSTVYRTLDALTEAGMVSHVHLGHGGAVYHLVGSHDHLHIVCDSCDKVSHVDVAVLDDARRQVEELTGFRISPGHFAIPAECPDCLTLKTDADAS